MKFTKIIGEIEDKTVELCRNKLTAVFTELSMGFTNTHFGSGIGGDPLVLNLVSILEHILTRNIGDHDIYTAATDGKRMFWNPEFVIKLSRTGLRFVASHEAWHAIFMHPNRRGSRIHQLFNICIDEKVNHTILKDLKARNIGKDPVALFKEHLGDFINVKDYGEFLKNPFSPPDSIAHLNPLKTLFMTQKEKSDYYSKFPDTFYADVDLAEEFKKPENIYEYLFAFLPKCLQCGAVGKYPIPEQLPKEVEDRKSTYRKRSIEQGLAQCEESKKDLTKKIAEAKSTIKNKEDLRVTLEDLSKKLKIVESDLEKIREIQSRPEEPCKDSGHDHNHEEEQIDSTPTSTKKGAKKSTKTTKKPAVKKAAKKASVKALVKAQNGFQSPFDTDGCPKCQPTQSFQMPQLKSQQGPSGEEEENEDGEGDQGADGQSDGGEKEGGKKPGKQKGQSADQNSKNKKNKGGHNQDRDSGENGFYDPFGVGQTLDMHVDADASEEELAKRLSDAIESTKRMAGTVPAGLEDELDDLIAPTMTWEDFYRLTVAKIKDGKGRNDWSRFRSKPMFSGLMIPKQKRKYVKTCIGLDSSGSMSPTDMAFGISQLQVMGQDSEGIVVTFDCSVYWASKTKITKFDVEQLKNIKVVGRGGTAVNDFLNTYYDPKNCGEVDVLIIITDGYLSDSELKDVRVPPRTTQVMWLITAHNESFKPPFGRVFHLEKPVGKH